MLKAGGSAVDAAVAVQAVLGLVEPQSSTIAGSGFMMYYDAKPNKSRLMMAVKPLSGSQRILFNSRYMTPNSPAPVPSARRSGRSIGVPGVMRLLEQAQKSMANLSGTNFLVKRLVWLITVSAYRGVWQMPLQVMQAI